MKTLRQILRYGFNLVKQSPIFALLFTTAFGLGAAQILAGSGARALTTDSLDIAPVWAAHPVGFSLLTHAPFQFVAFYDVKRQLTVARRKLDERKWDFTKLPVTTGWDSHNYVTMTVDDGGFIHLNVKD